MAPAAATHYTYYYGSWDWEGARAVLVENLQCCRHNMGVVLCYQAKDSGLGLKPDSLPLT